MTNCFSNLKAKLLSLFGSHEFKCIGCGVDTFDQRIAICEHCRSSVEYNNGKICLWCGRPIVGEGNYCGMCAKQDIFFDRAYSVMVHDGLARELMLKYKFGNARYMAKPFATMLCDLAVKENIPFDLVTYVPMTITDEKLRGYNQTRLLAEEFCAILNLPAPQEVLQKVKQTEKQEKLGYKDRITNLHNAFAVTDKPSVQGKDILVIDDVLTTGATLSEIARVLKKAKANRVYCVTTSTRREKILLD